MHWKVLFFNVVWRQLYRSTAKTTPRVKAEPNILIVMWFLFVGNKGALGMSSEYEIAFKLESKRALKFLWLPVKCPIVGREQAFGDFGLGTEMSNDEFLARIGGVRNRF